MYFFVDFLKKNFLLFSEKSLRWFSSHELLQQPLSNAYFRGQKSHFGADGRKMRDFLALRRFVLEVVFFKWRLTSGFGEFEEAWVEKKLRITRQQQIFSSLFMCKKEKKFNFLVVSYNIPSAYTSRYERKRQDKLNFCAIQVQQEIKNNQLAIDVIKNDLRVGRMSEVHSDFSWKYFNQASIHRLHETFGNFKQ